MISHKSQHQPLLFPNQIGRIFLNAFEEVIGHDELTEINKISGLTHLINTLPPNNLEPQFCADDLARIDEAIEEVYGRQAGRGIEIRAGRISFKHGLRDLGDTVGISELEFKLLPLPQKIERGFKILTSLAQKHTLQRIELEKSSDKLSLHITHCPLCYERVSEEPCCHLAVGVFREALYWISGGKNYLVEETSCIATGDPTCTFEISRTPLD